MKIGKRSEQAAQLSTDIDWGLIAAFWVGCRIIEKAPQKWKIEPKALELAKQIAAERAALLKRRQRRSPFPFCGSAGRHR